VIGSTTICKVEIGMITILYGRPAWCV
jgi:hypothetical protein